MRCNQINPAEYAQQILLDHSPLLTNVRRRLPIQSGVGFPKATEDKINLKRWEIAKEAQLEEVSPRIIVFLGGDDVGSPPVMDVDKSIDQNLLRKLRYSLPGMPFARKELTILKSMQNRPSIVLRDNLGIQQSIGSSSRSSNVEPDPSSLFAPPTDSTTSSSEMWRLRLMGYLLGIIVAISSFLSGRRCATALYHFRNPTTTGDENLNETQHIE